MQELFFYFLHLGTTGFGGPIALVSRMQTDLVENKKWVSAEEFDQGLALAKLSPGPLAAQLAMYLGWLRNGIKGAALAGFALIFPAFVMVVILAWLYIQFGQMPWIQRALVGVSSAVIAVIGVGAFKLVRKTTDKNNFLWILVFLVFITTVYTGSENVVLILMCGILAAIWGQLGQPSKKALVYISPSIFWTGIKHENNLTALAKMAVYFAKAGSFVFGSGLAIVPFLQPGVVSEHQWLTQQQFMDALGIAMITPGPVLIVVTFIGFLIAGISGAIVCTVATFFPCYLMVILFAPLFKVIMKHRVVKEITAGITAGACGAIAGSAVLLGKQTLTTPLFVGIFGVTFVCLIWVKKVPEVLLIFLAGGVAYFI